MRTWLAAAELWGMRDELVVALGPARVANRGAKAASANAALGLGEWRRAPHERLDELVERVSAEPLAGCRVVLQLDGVVDPVAVARLVRGGAEVIEVGAYRLSLPTDPSPARDLIRRPAHTSWRLSRSSSRRLSTTSLCWRGRSGWTPSFARRSTAG